MSVDKQFSLIKVSDVEYDQQISDSHILYEDLSGHFDLYIQETNLWSTNQQRITDAKYIVPYSDLIGTGNYTIEEATESWFSTPSV